MLSKTREALLEKNDSVIEARMKALESTYESKFVSVSVEDVEMKEWENSMQRIPAETIIVNPNKK